MNAGFCPGGGGVSTVPGQTIIVQQPPQANTGGTNMFQPPEQPKNDDRWLVLLDDRPRVRTPPVMPYPPPFPPPPFPMMPPVKRFSNFDFNQYLFNFSLGHLTI